MKQFEIDTLDGKKVTFNFPNSIKEIDENYLNEITKDLAIADNYTLVGMCYSEKLSNIILTARSKRDSKIRVTPIFIKAGKTDIDFIKNAKMKQRVVTMQSQLSLGVHVTLPAHKLTLDYFANVIKTAANKNIYEQELNNKDNRDCIFIEFKLIPNVDVIGLLDTDLSYSSDTYVKVTTNDIPEIKEKSIN